MEESLNDIRDFVSGCVADGVGGLAVISDAAATFAEEEHGLAGLRDQARRITAEVLRHHLCPDAEAFPGEAVGGMLLEHTFRVSDEGESVVGRLQLEYRSAGGAPGKAADLVRRVVAALSSAGLISPSNTSVLTWQRPAEEVPCLPTRST
jgi:hypothetical protein